MDYNVYMNMLDKEALRHSRGQVDWFQRKNGKLVPVTQTEVDKLLKVLKVAGKEGAKHLGFDSVADAEAHLKDESLRIPLSEGFLEWKQQQRAEFEKDFNYEVKRYEHAVQFGYNYFTIYNTKELGKVRKTFVKTIPHTELEYGDNTYVVYVGEGDEPLDESVKEKFFEALFEAIPELKNL